MHFDAIVQIIGPVFRIIAWVIGLLLLSNLLMAAIAASLAQWLTAVVVALGFTFWVFRKYFKNGIEWSFRPLWLYSTPLIFSSLMYVFVPRMDRIILGVVSDAQVVGIYSAAASLVFVLNLVHASTVKTFLPVVADAYNRISFDRAKMLYITVARWDSRLTFLVVVSSTLIAQEALALLGPSYASALLPFVILAVSVFVGTLPGPTGALLQMTNRQRVDAGNAVVFFVLYPSIQLALGLWIGWIGVAVGVLVVTIIINVVQTVEIRQLYGFHPFQQDHFRFTVLSLVVVGLCALAAISQPLTFRLALLGIVIGSFFIFVYLNRTSADTMMFRLMVDGTPLGSLIARFG